MKNSPGARPPRLRRMIALATVALVGAAGLGTVTDVATPSPAAAATSKQLVISGEAALGDNPWRWGQNGGGYASLKTLLSTHSWSNGGYTVDSDGIADITATGVLDGVDVFFAALPPGEYGPTQSAALQAFVQRGGHLVLNANKNGFGGLPQFLTDAGFALRASGFFGAGCGYTNNAAPNGTVAAGGSPAALTTGAAGLNLFHTVTAFSSVPGGATRLINYTNTAQPLAVRIIQPNVTNVDETGENIIARVQNSANATTAQLRIDGAPVGAPVAVNQSTGTVTLPTGAVAPGDREVVVRVTQAVTGDPFDSPPRTYTFGATPDAAAPDPFVCNGLDSASDNDFLVATGPHTVAALVAAGAATFGGATTGAVIVTSDLDIYSNVYGDGLTGANRQFAINSFQYLLDQTLGVDFAPATAFKPGVASTMTTTLTANSGNLTYSWSFPTGTPATSTAASPSVTFPSEGTVSVTLTVVDTTSGARGTTTKTFDVGTSSFIALPNPVRIYNSRDVGKIGSASTRVVPIRGLGGIPSGARTVIMNVTVVDSDAGGYLQVWPTGDPQPADTSTHNFKVGETFPNLVVSKIGTDGSVSVFNAAGTVHILVDAVGYTVANSTGARLTSVAPTRVFNTRDGNNTTQAPLGQGETRSIQMRGVAGIPGGATAVVLNLTSDRATTTGSYVTAWPTGQGVPDASNLNLIQGVTRPNVAVVAIGSDGRINVRNEFGTTELFADVVGYFGPAALGGITGVNPQRVFNTRLSTPMGPNESREIQVRGVAGVPTDARTVILKVTVDASSAGGYLSVGPNAFGGEPSFSNLNFLPEMTVPNLVISQIGSDGRVRVYNNAGTVTVLVDVLGYAD